MYIYISTIAYTGTYRNPKSEAFSKKKGLGESYRFHETNKIST